MNKKIIILGNIKVNGYKHGIYSWFVKTYFQGLTLNGYDVYLIDYKTNSIKQIKEKLLNIKSSFCITHLTFHNFHPMNQILDMFKQVNKQVETKFIHTCGDARTHDRYMDDISQYFYHAFVGTYDMVKNCTPVWKIPVTYMPYSSLTYDVMGDYNSNLDFKMPVFTGGPNTHKDRSDFIKRLQKIMPIKIFQTQSNNDMREQTLSLSASSIILGLSTKYEINGYIDVRPFQYLGCGAIMIMREFKGMESFLPYDIYYPFYSYDDPQIVKENWKMIQKTDTKQIQLKAFRFIQRYHSSKVRMKQTMKILEE